MSQIPPVVDPKDPVDPTEPDPTPPEENRNVSFETHQRLLREKKAASKEAADLKAKLEAIEREKLEAQGEYKKIADAEKARADALTAQLAQRNEDDLLRRKLIALGTEAGVDNKYLRFLDPDEVAVDPATGEIDKATLVKAAQKVRSEFPAFLKKPAGATPPAGAPTGDGGTRTITKAEWDKLPSKEMLKWKQNQIIGL